jgi:hypothetical protein
MDSDEALLIVQDLLHDITLNKTQVMIFSQIWQGLSYQAIAKQSGYNEGYVRSVGSKLLQAIAHACGERVTKNNLPLVVKRYKKQRLQTGGIEVSIRHRPVLQESRAGQQDWGDAIDVANFWGRSHELHDLSQWIMQDRCRMVGILGAEGIGKTALSVKLAEAVQHDFEYVLWRSLRYAPPLQDLLATFIQFFSDQTQEPQALPQNLGDRLSLLIQAFRQSRCLLVLSDYQMILSNQTDDHAVHLSEYGELLRRIGEIQHQSCLVLASAQKPQEIAVLQGDTLPVRALTLKGLEASACQQLLRAKGLGPSPHIPALIAQCEGNPLALKIAATLIQDEFQGDIERFLQAQFHQAEKSEIPASQRHDTLNDSRSFELKRGR